MAAAAPFAQTMEEPGTSAPVREPAESENDTHSTAARRASPPNTADTAESSVPAPKGRSRRHKYIRNTSALRVNAAVQKRRVSQRDGGTKSGGSGHDVHVSDESMEIAMLSRNLMIEAIWFKSFSLRDRLYLRSLPEEWEGPSAHHNHDHYHHRDKGGSEADRTGARHSSMRAHVQEVDEEERETEKKKNMEEEEGEDESARRGEGGGEEGEGTEEGPVEKEPSRGAMVKTRSSRSSDAADGATAERSSSKKETNTRRHSVHPPEPVLHPLSESEDDSGIMAGNEEDANSHHNIDIAIPVSDSDFDSGIRVGGSPVAPSPVTGAGRRPWGEGNYLIANWARDDKDHFDAGESKTPQPERGARPNGTNAIKLETKGAEQTEQHGTKERVVALTSKKPRRNSPLNWKKALAKAGMKTPELRTAKPVPTFGGLQFFSSVKKGVAQLQILQSENVRSARIRKEENNRRAVAQRLAGQFRQNSFVDTDTDGDRDDDSSDGDGNGYDGDTNDGTENDGSVIQENENGWRKHSLSSRRKSRESFASQHRSQPSGEDRGTTLKTKSSRSKMLISEKARAILGESSSEIDKDHNRIRALTEEEIAYKIITQHDILHGSMESGCYGRAMARVYPYFPPEAYSMRARAVEFAIMVLVMLNVIVMIISTEQGLFYGESGESLQQAFDAFEYFCFAVFILEFGMRMWVCTLDERYHRRGEVWGRMVFLVSFNSIIDLLALLPSFIEIAHRASQQGTAADENIGVGSSLRLWRIIRILKLEHYTSAASLLKGGFAKQAHLFQLVLTYPIVAWLIFATILSYTETLENNCPEETAAHFTSIPRALFPTLLMLTGEAPLLELTWMGQIVASLIALFAMVIMATVTGIIASGFEQAMVENNVAKQVGMETRRALKNHIQEGLSKKGSSIEGGNTYFGGGFGKDSGGHQHFAGRLSTKMMERRSEIQRALGGVGSSTD